MQLSDKGGLTDARYEGMRLPLEFLEATARIAFVGQSGHAMSQLPRTRESTFGEQCVSGDGDDARDSMPNTKL